MSLRVLNASPGIAGFDIVGNFLLHIVGGLFLHHSPRHLTPNLGQAYPPHPLQAVRDGVPGVDHPLAEEDPSYIQPAVAPPDI